MEDCWLQCVWTKQKNTCIRCAFCLWFVLWVWSFYFWDFTSEAAQLSHLTCALQSTWSQKSVINAWSDIFPTFLRLYSTRLFCASRTGRGINLYWALSSTIPCSHSFSVQAKQRRANALGNLEKGRSTSVCIHGATETTSVCMCSCWFSNLALG